MKTRKIIIAAAVVAAATALFVLSIIGTGQGEGRSSVPAASEKAIAFLGDKSGNEPNMNPADSTGSNSKNSSASASSGEASSQTAPTPPSTPSSSGPAGSLATQVSNSVHGRIFGGQTGGNTCQICHEANNADYALRQTGWDTCGTCHVSSAGNPVPGIEVQQHPQYQMIQGVAIGDILPMPAYKYKYMKEGFSCINCHTTNAAKHDFQVPGVNIIRDTDGIRRANTSLDLQNFKEVFKQDSCDVCHPSTAETINRVEEIQSVIGDKLEELQPIYNEWSQKIKSMDSQDPRVVTFMNGATYYTFVYSDGSKGVHNFPYARLLLEKAELIWRGLSL